MNMASAMLLYFAGIFAGIICTAGCWWIMGREEDKEEEEMNTADHLEDLVSRLRAMKVILGLSRTEKETLEEAADFISNIATDIFMEKSEDDKRTE